MEQVSIIGYREKCGSPSPGPESNRHLLHQITVSLSPLSYRGTGAAPHLEGEYKRGAAKRMGEKGVARPSLELGSGLYRRAIQTQFSAGIVILSEELRYAQIIRARPGLWRPSADSNCCNGIHRSTHSFMAVYKADSVSTRSAGRSRFLCVGTPGQVIAATAFLPDTMTVGSAAWRARPSAQFIGWFSACGILHTEGVAADAPTPPTLREGGKGGGKKVGAQGHTPPRSHFRINSGCDSSKRRNYQILL